MVDWTGGSYRHTFVFKSFSTDSSRAVREFRLSGVIGVV